MKSTACCAALWACSVAGAGEAAAATTVRLPLGQSFTALEVSSTGQAWVTSKRRALGRGAWAIVDGAGRPAWHSMTAADFDFRGQLEPLPDGGMWIMRDTGSVLRVGADGATFEVPPGDTWDEPRTTSTSDGTFVLTDQIGTMLRVGRDGAVDHGEFRLPPGPFEPLDCELGDLAALPDGRLVAADYGCGRLVTRGIDGKVTERELTGMNPYELLARPDGSLWFAAEGPDDGATIGRIAPDGTLTRFDVPRPPGALAAAPDGAVWVADANACRLYRVSGDQLEQRPAPFVTRALRFAPDGGLWLMGHTRLEHLSATELAAPARCDVTGPRLTLPDRREGRLSARTVRRRGLRLRANEAGHLAAVVQRSNDGRLVNRVLERGRTITLRLPARWLRPGAEFLISGRLTDADGNHGDLPVTVKLGR